MAAVSGHRSEKAEGFHRSHARRLFDFAFRWTRDVQAAEDVVQETLKVALEKDAPASLEGPWLFRIARNKLAKLTERRARRRERVLDAALVEQPARHEEPAQVLAAEEDRARVARALETLEPDLASVVRLFYEDRLGHKEIAERLAIPATTVQSRLRSALKKLHEELL
jgi:RNA polymerase sigma-70 factor (ECF subfamily)